MAAESARAAYPGILTEDINGHCFDEYSQPIRMFAFTTGLPSRGSSSEWVPREKNLWPTSHQKNKKLSILSCDLCLNLLKWDLVFIWTFQNWTLIGVGEFYMLLCSNMQTSRATTLAPENPLRIHELPTDLRFSSKDLAHKVDYRAYE